MNFEYADRVIKDMNRRNLRAFDRLKLLKFDEMNVFRSVSKVYDDSVTLAKKRYLQIAREAFEAALILCGMKPEKAEEQAEETIMDDWILDMMEDYDPVTLYQFLPEAERKKQRLVEALIASHNKGEQVDKALRLWTLQIAHYADRSVVDATVEGYKEAGVKKVRWVAVEDEKVCPVCAKRDGKIYAIGKIPARPHYHCRCVLEPILKEPYDA